MQEVEGGEPVEISGMYSNYRIHSRAHKIPRDTYWGWCNACVDCHYIFTNSHHNVSLPMPEGSIQTALACCLSSHEFDCGFGRFLPHPLMYDWPRWLAGHKRWASADLAKRNQNNLWFFLHRSSIFDASVLVQIDRHMICAYFVPVSRPEREAKIFMCVQSTHVCLGCLCLCHFRCANQAADHLLLPQQL